MIQLVPVFGLEDDLDDIESIKETFTEEGITPYEFFPDPKEFLEMLKQCPDARVIVIDYNLPHGYDGHIVLNRAKQINPKCRPVIISGLITPDMRLRLELSKAADFVEKKAGKHWQKELADRVKIQITLAQEEIEEERAQLEELKKDRQNLREEIKQLRSQRNA